MFTVGDRVHLPNIGTGTIREVRNRGMYVVEIKGRMIVARGDELTAAAGGKRSQASRPDLQVGRMAPTSAPLHETLRRAHSPAEIDLHGMTAADAVAALDQFLNDAILAAHEEVRVIHGRSGGRLKAAVHQRLRALSSVRSFRLDPRNPGVTIVSLGGDGE